MTDHEKAWIAFGRAYQIYLEEKYTTESKAKMVESLMGPSWIAAYRFFRNDNASDFRKKLIRAWELRCWAIKLRKEARSERQ